MFVNERRRLQRRLACASMAVLATVLLHRLVPRSYTALREATAVLVLLPGLWGVVLSCQAHRLLLREEPSLPLEGPYRSPPLRMPRHRRGLRQP